ncbi:MULTISPECIES: VOC family protein [Bacillaceae]|uniref:VOC family protein n=1 Tax=Bacillaceae TaxID=186817 RepID=UPI000B43EA00|nr:MULTISPECIES: VOC family protein [Bacillaceae]
MEKGNITGIATTMVVKDVKESVEFYKKLGFKHEVIGSNPAHHHVHRDKLTIIFHPTNKEEEIRPGTSYVDSELYYFDIYCYVDGLDLLVNEIKSNGIEIVRGPNYSEHWSEITIKDINGYCIAFGGGIADRQLLKF